ncbi:condensation domain-containing protein [Dactylosporangium sp. NPDC000244]|uniref:condensation domain-containing protein n=1 Tax=Dactylosporangium sp. NPDC000244 TaxID=3154365 RepID=UPI00331650C2
MSSRIAVPFSGAGSGSSALTWGQQAMLQAMAREHSWLPMGGHRPVAAGTTVADVAAQLRYTMERWQSMRTRIADGRQQVAADGVAVLEVFPDGGMEAAAAVEAAYRAAAPDLAADWPLRMAVICDRGRPAHLVAVMPHLVTDGLGAAVMLGESARRVASPPAGPQPLDIAAWQASPPGERQHAAARRHWDRHAGGLVPFTSRAMLQRYQRCLHDSARLSARLPGAAARLGTDESTVLLAAYFAALARVTGRATIAVRQVVSNRFRSGLSDVVTPLTQFGLCALDVPPSFPDAVAAVARAALPARKYAYYDPDRVPSPQTPCFNDRRALALTDPPSAAPAGPTEPLFLHVDSVPGAVRLLFDVDTACFAPGTVAALAREMESVV